MRSAGGESAPPRIRARALVELAFLYLIAGTYERAEFFSSSAILLARQAGNVHRLSQALFVHAHIIGTDDRRRYESIMLLEEAVDLVHDHEPLLDIYPAALADLGWMLVRVGERERGLATMQQALTILRASGRHLEIGMSLLRIGRLDQQAGETRRAAARYGESLMALRMASGSLSPPVTSAACFGSRQDRFITMCMLTDTWTSRCVTRIRP